MLNITEIHHHDIREELQRSEQQHFDELCNELAFDPEAGEALSRRYFRLDPHEVLGRIIGIVAREQLTDHERFPNLLYEHIKAEIRPAIEEEAETRAYND